MRVKTVGASRRDPSARRQIELLRDLEELDTSIRDVENPTYPADDLKVRVLDYRKAAEKNRAALCGRVEDRLLVEYERIRRRYGSRVVVQVVNEFCGGCYIKLPSELMTREKTQVLSCPNCGRFLYRVK